MMKPVVFLACLCLSLGSAYGRLTADELRASLSVNPLFSHARGSPFPFMQNTNIRLPLSEAAVQTINDRTSNARPMTSEALTNELSANARPVMPEARSNNRPSNTRPITSEARSNNIPVNTRPVMPEVRSNNRPSNARPKTSESHVGGLGTPVQQKRRVVPVPAGKPKRRPQIVLGQVRPTQVAQEQPAPAPVNAQAKSQQRIAVSQPSINSVSDRQLNNIMPAANVAPVEVKQADASKQKCHFEIPSFLSKTGSKQNCPLFLLPGSSISISPDSVNQISSNSRPEGGPGRITQVDLEQKCLMPALRGFILGGDACKTRELKVYLEWLLYLRQTLFNI